MASLCGATITLKNPWNLKLIPGNTGFYFRTHNRTKEVLSYVYVYVCMYTAWNPATIIRIVEQGYR